MADDPDFAKGASGPSRVYQMSEALPVLPAGLVSGETAAQPALQADVVLSGTVSSGARDEGTGFEVSKTATGTYSITFDVVLTAKGICIASPHGSTAGMISTSGGVLGATVRTFDDTGTAADLDFSFIIVTVK